MRLIVNADDLGYSAARDKRIVDCCVRGVVTSASLLVNGSSARSAVHLLTSLAPHASLGLHLNLTEGIPVLHPSKVSSLLELSDSQAPPRFLGKTGFRAAIDAGRIVESEVLEEARAQLELFFKYRGSAPSHIDGHQHIQSLAIVATAIATIIRDDPSLHGLTATRIPRVCAAERALMGVLPTLRRTFYEAVDAGCAAAAVTVASANIRAPHVFIGYSTMGHDCSVDAVVSLLQAVSGDGASLKDATIGTWVEWMVHPGRTLATEAASAGCGEASGADEFSQDIAREWEATVLCDARLKEELRRIGIQLASYTEFSVAVLP